MITFGSYRKGLDLKVLEFLLGSVLEEAMQYHLSNVTPINLVTTVYFTLSNMTEYLAFPNVDTGGINFYSVLS